MYTQHSFTGRRWQHLLTAAVVASVAETKPAQTLFCPAGNYNLVRETPGNPTEKALIAFAQRAPKRGINGGGEVDERGLSESNECLHLFLKQLEPEIYCCIRVKTFANGLRIGENSEMYINMNHTIV